MRAAVRLFRTIRKRLRTLQTACIKAFRGIRTFRSRMDSQTDAKGGGMSFMDDVMPHQSAVTTPAAPEPSERNPLNPTGDPELARLLSLPPGERLVALVQAGYRMEFEAGRLVRVVKLADIEGEPEALAEDQHQGDTDTGRVCCGECARFRRNRIGDPVHGIGRCSIFENPPGGPLWPKAERRCSRFVSIASDGGEA
jgi:hypothetical protein